MIRSARADEIEAIGRIEHAADQLFRGTHLEWAIGKWPPQHDRYRRALREGRLWVWEEDGRPAGFVAAYRIGEVLYIAQLAVAATAQRKGIGSALMERAIAEARGDFSAAALITDRLIAWNMPFYASLGFEEWPDPSPGIQAELDEEFEDGFDPATRVAMILRF